MKKSVKTVIMMLGIAAASVSFSGMENNVQAQRAGGMGCYFSGDDCRSGAGSCICVPIIVTVPCEWWLGNCM